MNHSELKSFQINHFLCLFVLTMNHLQVNHSQMYHSQMTYLLERTADAVGCAGPAGWSCKWAGLEE